MNQKPGMFESKIVYLLTGLFIIASFALMGYWITN